MPQPFSLLGDISIDTFLSEYWQQKPLLVRQAFPDFEAPLSADELAGLALEDWIESRLVIEHGKQPWELRNGPFTEKDFAKLPESHWTLLVQAVDQVVPDVAELLDYFRFLPNWRVDDIMISYAVDQGSVGPHFDYYDVFLIQAEGKRTWKLGQTCDALSPRLENTSLNILSHFDQQEEWTLEPGDMLYLPPQLAHWGIAQGECMTYSVGFRAPSHADIINDITAEYTSQLQNHQRFSDATQRQQQHPGRITAADIQQLQQLLQRLADNPTAIAQWFGEYMTQPKYEQDKESVSLSDEQHTQQELHQLLSTEPAEVDIIAPALDARLAFYEDTDNNVWLFSNGETFATNLAFAEWATGHTVYSVLQCQKILQAAPENTALLTTLLSKGILVFLD